MPLHVAPLMDLKLKARHKTAVGKLGAQLALSALLIAGSEHLSWNSQEERAEAAAT